MKIRIRKNTIRYRLDKVDMEQLEQGQVAEKTAIGAGALTFLVQTDPEATTPQIALEPFSVTLTIPRKTAQPVIEGKKTGFDCMIPAGNGEPLKILLEQDFRCLIPREEEDNHAFDNPLEKKDSC